jgi:hypothetical protein
VDETSIELMRKLLRPVTADEIAAVVRTRTGAASGGEQLTLADADLEDEVRELRAVRDSR